MPNDNSTNDLSIKKDDNNKPKKGLLQSLHSLSFDDDDDDLNTSKDSISSINKDQSENTQVKNNNAMPPIPSMNSTVVNNAPKPMVNNNSTLPNVNNSPNKNDNSYILNNTRRKVVPIPNIDDYNDTKMQNISNTDNKTNNQIPTPSASKPFSNQNNMNNAMKNNQNVPIPSVNGSVNNVTKPNFSDSKNSITDNRFSVEKNQNSNNSKILSNSSKETTQNKMPNTFSKNSNTSDSTKKHDANINSIKDTSSYSNPMKLRPSGTINSSKDLNISNESTNTLYDIENSLNIEMKKNMKAVKESAINIKQKSKYDLITSFGSDNTEVVVFNTFLNQEIPYVYKNGKTSNQRVHAFGVMTGYGVYTIRSSSAVTPKLEDALKYTHNNTSKEVGVLGEGSSRRIVLHLPPQDYGEDKVLDIPLITSKKDLEEHKFNGLDAISVDMRFIDDLMNVAVEEVRAMVDYEDKRKATLQALKTKTNDEVKKASAIADKLNELSF